MCGCLRTKFQLVYQPKVKETVCMPAVLLLYIVQESSILMTTAHFSTICFHVRAHEPTVSVGSVAPVSRIRVSDMMLLLTERN